MRAFHAAHGVAHGEERDGAFDADAFRRDLEIVVVVTSAGLRARCACAAGGVGGVLR